jgi:hypothetical protein
MIDIGISCGRGMPIIVVALLLAFLLAARVRDT